MDLIILDREVGTTCSMMEMNTERFCPDGVINKLVGTEVCLFK